MKVTINISKKDADELRVQWGRGEDDRRGRFTRNNFSSANSYAAYLVAQEIHRQEEQRK